MKTLFVTILLSFSISFKISAQQVSDQQDKTGNWLMYFGQNKVSAKLSIHSEIQYRNHTFEPVNIEQLLLRTGLNFHFAENALATAGYGYIASHDYESEQSSPEKTEHRIWQQLITTNVVGKVKFEHRYRIEQRWINNQYRNRLRYRLMVFLPLNTQKIEPGSFYLGIYDEIFLNTEQSFFDRNRLYGSLGYQFNEKVGVQWGILRQRINEFGKWYMQFAVIFNPDFRKDSENLPN